MSRQRHLRARILSWMIRWSVPVLNYFRRTPPWPYSLADLRAFPPQTLGAATAAFLDARHFGFLPQYETHDVLHALLGYGTTTTGELRLQAFMWGNRSASFAGRILFLLGAMVVPELWTQLRVDYRRGRCAARIRDLHLDDLVHESLETARHTIEPHAA